MSQDLLTQLAAYGTYCDERQGPVLADDTIVPLPMPIPPTPRRGWLVAVAAAALILIVVGGVTWLKPFGDSISPTGEPTETIPQTTIPETTVPATSATTVPESATAVPVSPTTVPGPTATAPRAAESLTWTRHEGSVPSGGIQQTPVGLVVTRIVDFQVPLVYMSLNGFEWTEVPIPAAANVPIPEDSYFDVEPTQSGTWLRGPTGDLWFADMESWSSGQPSWEEVASEVDLLQLVGPAPSGLRWASAIAGKARIGNTNLVAVQWEVTIDYGAILDLPPGYTNIQHDDLDSCYSGGTSGQLSVRGTDSSGEEVCLTRVTVVDEAAGVSVFDEDGDQVAFIENAVADFAYGSGGPHISLPSQMLDLYASTDGQLALVRSVDDAIDGCSHGPDQSEGSVVHSIDCPDSTLNGALSTDDGVTWDQVPYEDPASLPPHHPLGFFWQSTWPWGPADDKQGPPAILVSKDGVSWIELVRGHGYDFETPGGLVITLFDEEGDLADDIVVYDGELLSTVHADWPVGIGPEFLGAIGNTLILIDGADAWVGEVFEN